MHTHEYTYKHRFTKTCTHLHTFQKRGKRYRWCLLVETGYNEVMWFISKHIVEKVLRETGLQRDLMFMPHFLRENAE